MLTQGMWMAILKDCYVCTYQVDTLSDWAWTLQFQLKMACDGIHICSSGPVGSDKTHNGKFARNTSAIHIQSTTLINYYMY